MAKKRKRTPWCLRYRKNDPGHNMLVSTQRWIHANGGTALLLGGIDIVQLPEDNPLKYRVAVVAIGKKPSKKDKACNF